MAGRQHVDGGRLADIDVEVRLSPTPETSSLNLDKLPTTIVVLGYTSIDAHPKALPDDRLASALRTARLVGPRGG